jgi:hypothetical protein
VEKLRRFAKRLLGANEKVVFALMVGVLIWRVVQIVYTPPPPPPPPPPPIIPIEEGETQQPMKSSRQDPERFANVSVARWTVPGTQERVTEEDEPDDAGLPSITCEGTQPVGDSVWAKIRTDQRLETVRPGSYFANRRAKLDEIDTNGKKIVFTWVFTGRQYERQIAG